MPPIVNSGSSKEFNGKHGENDPVWEITHLVATGVNADYTRNLEVPLQVGVSKRSHESARSTVDVDGHVKASALLQVVERVGEFLDRFVVTGVGASQNGKDTNRILIDLFNCLFDVEAVVRLWRDGHFASLNIKVPTKLLDAHLAVCAEDEIRTRLFE